MVEVIRFPPIFQSWENASEIIRKHLDGQIAAEQEEEILTRFREIYDRLPSRVGDISLSFDGLEHLSEKELDVVYSALGGAIDQIHEELQTFAGQILGEIFALVLELSRNENRSDRKAIA
jgi:hypothetical protein